jgi:hypothetical protein
MQWASLASDVTAGARLFSRLPPILRSPIRPEIARPILRRRLERRGDDLLGLLREAVYSVDDSPYRALLQQAGCEYGDAERLVRQEGVESALQVLLRRGVYLTVEEFKGRRPAVRGSTTIEATPAWLTNPCTTTHLSFQSSGSGGTPTPIPLDLAHIRERAVDACLYFEACGGLAWQHAIWGPPGGWPIFQLIQFGAAGARPSRWFSQLDPAAGGLSSRYVWSGRTLQAASTLLRAGLPRPEHVPLDDPLPIARWMAGVLQEGDIPYLRTFVSPAVQLAQAAAAAGISLEGAQLMISGEPITAARRATIEQTGAAANPNYGVNEAGSWIGFGCLSPEAPDDVHLFHDLVAMIQVDAAATPPAADGLPPGAVLSTSLRPTAPLLLLNVSMGDQAMLYQRACGCPIEQLGWTTHLHTIRSFEKLTTGGLTLLDVDVIRILEEVLPGRFGGAPTDYQLVESEDAAGQPYLRLLVRPEVGPVDPLAVQEAFLGAVGQGAGGARIVELLWRQADLLRVERRAPLATSTGKILHLHRERPPNRPPPAAAHEAEQAVLPGTA